jgi:hypothetical protein
LKKEAAGNKVVVQYVHRCRNKSRLLRNIPKICKYGQRYSNLGLKLGVEMRQWRMRCKPIAILVPCCYSIGGPFGVLGVVAGTERS